MSKLVKTLSFVLIIGVYLAISLASRGIKKEKVLYLAPKSSVKITKKVSAPWHLSTNQLKLQIGWETLQVKGAQWLHYKEPWEKALAESLLKSREFIVDSIRNIYGVEIPQDQIIEVEIKKQPKKEGNSKCFNWVEVHVTERSYPLGLVVGFFGGSSQEIQARAFLSSHGLGPKLGCFVNNWVLTVEPIAGETLASLTRKGQWKLAYQKKIDAELELVIREVTASDLHWNNVILEEETRRPVIVDPGILSPGKEKDSVAGKLFVQLLSYCGDFGNKNEREIFKDLDWMAEEFVLKAFEILDLEEAILFFRREKESFVDYARSRMGHDSRRIGWCNYFWQKINHYIDNSLDANYLSFIDPLTHSNLEESL